MTQQIQQIQQSLIEFQSARKKFIEKQPKQNIDILELVATTINELLRGPESTPNGFLSWDANSLIHREAVLSGLTRRLSELKAEYEAQADWVKTEMYSMEKDIYENIIKENKKITVDNFKRQLASIQKETLQEIILLKNEAKNVEAHLIVIDKICFAIIHRLKEIRNI